MSPLSDPGEFGQQLYVARFKPLPDVDNGGNLIGTRMWRLREGYVEYLALNKNGLAHAVRAEAQFAYGRPTDHGRVVGHRFGSAGNALDWLLHTEDEPYSELVRPYIEPYVDPNPVNPWRDPDEGDQR